MGVSRKMRRSSACVGEATKTRRARYGDGQQPRSPDYHQCASHEMPLMILLQAHPYTRLSYTLLLPLTLIRLVRGGRRLIMRARTPGVASSANARQMAPYEMPMTLWEALCIIFSIAIIINITPIAKRMSGV
ncbi:hypothetical protein E2C01_010610 [Portunus trituberculatus]|uniref:Uncharacterized protein n=1 Tax=Portunus trituberculatus TaxID=210409 RepID=A0A5B7D979_PORTR|nr:hypothetical protein [Portunus trituberculatus]